MAYIQQEGGERFVIPSYRDVIAKRKSQLKTDILQLSSKYGEFLSFQRRGLAQFEVAFSNDAGYLFGECVWSYFKNPKDLIYCEAIPDTTEAYLVIVKNGSVYLDGIFPFENIAEELLVFTTQKNDFEIYLYGDVPISLEPTEGKFSFEASLVKAFTFLDAPLFYRLPVVQAYQLQLVDVVLRQQGIGIFPVKYVILLTVILGLLWMGYSYLTLHKKKIPIVTRAPVFENPYIDFNKALTTPAPDQEITQVIQEVNGLLTLPGWTLTEMNYSEGKINFNVQSLGASTYALFQWAAHKAVQVEITPQGFSLLKVLDPPLKGRELPTKIYPLDLVMSSLIDRLALVVPGNILQVEAYKSVKAFKQTRITIKLNDVSPETVIILASQLKEMPLVLTSMAFKINHGLTGTIILQALGS